MKLLKIIALISELIHIAGHTQVLLGGKVRDPGGKQWYFYWDGLSSLFAFILTGFTKPLIVIPHFVLHLAYYAPFLNKAYYAKRIRDWSAIGYKGHFWTVDWLLTLYDITTHVVLVGALWRRLTANKAANLP